MDDRFDQAVASQGGQKAPHDPPRPPRAALLIGWGTALAALAISVAVVTLVVWFLRIPIATFVLNGALAQRGVEADFRLTKLDLDGATLRDVRFGPANDPDASIAALEARWTWNGLAPRLLGLRLVEPRLHLRLNGGGQVSGGSLDRFSGAPTGQRPQIPRMALAIERGELVLDAPFGALTAEVRAAGELGVDFSGHMRLREITAANDGYRLDHGAADVFVVSRGNALIFRAAMEARALVWGDTRASAIALRVGANAPMDLSRYRIEAAWRAAWLRTTAFEGAGIDGRAQIDTTTRNDSLLPSTWRLQTRASAERAVAQSVGAGHMHFDAALDGADLQGHGRWTLAADSFSGAALKADRVAATGSAVVALNGAGSLNANGQVALQHARLEPSAARSLHGVLPDIDGGPTGPTFANARDALDAAARNFDLLIPFTMQVEPRGGSIALQRLAMARAANGVLLRLLPLRVDAPALTLQWPDASLHGAVDIELSGGGAPSAALLLDTIDWSPGAPLEGEGTLSLSDWRTENASIAADELNIGVSFGPRDRGRVDLHGPAHISGPIGDGEVHDMVADLNLGFVWDRGWRVVSDNHCVPVRFGTLEVAGFSFNGGRFDVCPLDSALIASDASQRLSGGFRVRTLALDGRMAGPQAEPSRLSAAGVIGRFRGTGDDALLAIQVDAPALRVDFGEARPLALTGARLTADAHLARDWSVDGAFTDGALSDPALPGAVTAIAGRWAARPQDGRAIVSISAGEALLTANPPISDQQRPLFHPLRLAGFSATLHDGAVDATGGLVLAEKPRQLARFTAHHDVARGEGVAHFTADALVFDRTLQPYDITELARGMVDNVRGGASAAADVTWTRDAITATGLLHLDGVSLSASTIPIVQGVRGDVHFDNLFALTTPPGQEIAVDVLNPGLAVHDGRVRFQLLPDQRIAIESAQFEFASGALSMTPTTIQAGAAETRFELAMQNVDAAALLANLNIPDLAATGRLEGRFPLLLTRRTATIEHGVLRAMPGGGTIAYVGRAGDNVQGAARLAFEALRSFRYDDLSLTLNGDLNGELVSSIEFSGHNSGAPVHLGRIAPMLGDVSVRGVPFAFHVTLTAPFRSLAETAASIGDANGILRRARDGQVTPEVDQSQATPR